MSLAVVQTSTATLVHHLPLNRGSRTIEATSLTFEVAVHGASLDALRRIARAGQMDLMQAIQAAVEDFLATNGNQHLLESPLVALLEQEGLQ